MDFNDMSENQDTPPQEPKVPNLLKNRETHNNPSGAETENIYLNNDFQKTENESIDDQNPIDNIEDYEFQEMERKPPDEEETASTNTDSESQETENQFINYDHNENQDFVPDNNDIPPILDNHEFTPDDNSASPFDETPNIGEFTLPDDYNPDEDILSYDTASEDNDTNIVSEIEADTISSNSNDSQSFSPTEEENQQESKPYVPPKKINAADAMGKMQPLKLNRQMILALILGFVCLSFLFVSFILPALNQKKEEAAAKKKHIEQTNQTDYSLYAQKNNNFDNDDYSNFYNENSDEVYIPEPFEYFPPEAQQPNQPPPSSSGTYLGSGGSERPDTRNDRLQAKSISGIKGISSSRQNFATPMATINPITAALTPGQNNENPYAQFGMPPKDEYVQNMLNTYSRNPTSNGYDAQNNQGGKLDFMNQGRENSGSGQWLPINSVWQGTIFEATLTSAINTDLPGECTAWVTKNVYSSLDGTLLLIPQNSRLLGSYNSSISYSQSRVQIGWHTLIRPDGYMINLGNMNATDPQGAVGLKGFVNDHPFAYLKALGLLTALNLVNTQLGSSMDNTNNPYVQNVLANSQDMSNRLADKIIDRALDIQPTIIIRAGITIQIVANQNLILPPLIPYGVTNKYQRGK